MKEKKAIPDGYMTVGEVAKKMGVTVRALQYYDREGLFSPSAVSEGGRRLYNDKDLFNLHRILSFKSLGFSFSEIKSSLNSLDTPEEVVKALEQQSKAVKEQLQKLNKTLCDIERLKREVLSMKEVDFKKYADIIVNLQMDNEGYTVIKFMDEKTLEKARSRFNKESAKIFIEKLKAVLEKAEKFKKDGVSVESKEAFTLAEAFWQLINEFTGGDMSVISQLMQLSNADIAGEWKEKQQIINDYITPALEKYFESVEKDIFKEKK